MNDRQTRALNEPAIYQIHIQGTLDESWGDYYGGQIIPSADGTETTLRTLSMDQAALVGLVNRLNGLGLRILLVEHEPFEEDRN